MKCTGFHQTLETFAKLFWKGIFSSIKANHVACKKVFGESFVAHFPFLASEFIMDQHWSGKMEQASKKGQNSIESLKTIF